MLVGQGRVLARQRLRLVIVDGWHGGKLSEMAAAPPHSHGPSVVCVCERERERERELHRFQPSLIPRLPLLFVLQVWGKPGIEASFMPDRNAASKVQEMLSPE